MHTPECVLFVRGTAPAVCHICVHAAALFVFIAHSRRCELPRGASVG